MTAALSNYPLAGLKVLDFSRVLAGPFAGRMLCDLGADVVKVEPPDGDVTRFWGKVVGGVPGYYHQQNAGKRNIRLLPDGWTVITKDHSLSAQWEHTVLVTETGHEVLTVSENMPARPKVLARSA